MARAAAVVSALALSATASAAIDENPTFEFYEDALERFEAGDNRAAIVQLKNVLQRDKKNLPARILLGLAYLREGATAAAEKEFRQARSLGADPNHITEPLAVAYLLQRKYERIFDDFDERRLNPKTIGQLRVVQGKAHVQTNNFREADFMFREAARLLPSSAAPNLGLAIVALNDGRADEAQRYATRAAEIGPQDPETWYVHGEIRRDEGEVNAAIDYYSRVLEIEPNHIVARSARASALISSGRPEDAEPDLKVLQEQVPNDPQVTYLRALMLAQTEKFDEARAVLQSASQFLLGMDQDWLQSNGPSLLLLGFIQHGQGNYDQAFSHLNRYVKFFPRNIGARKLLADIYLRRNQSLSAVETLEPARKRAPDDASIALMLATAYAQRGQPERAIVELERAVELNPDDAAFRMQLALNRVAAGESEKAMDDLGIALDRAPNSPRPTILLTMLNLKRENFDAAIGHARTLVSRFSEDPVGYNLLGASLLGGGYVDEARSAFNRALAIAPQFHSAKLNLANLELDAGNFEASRRAYDQVLTDAPRETRAMLGLARLEHKASKLDQAINWLEKVRAILPDDISHQLKLIDLYLQTNQAPLAREIANLLEASNPEDLTVLMAVGRVQLAEDSPLGAAKTFARMSKLAGYSAPHLHVLASYQIRVNDIEGAEWSLEKAVQADPSHVEARLSLIRLNARRDKIDLAMERIDKLRQDFPEDPRSDAVLGDVYIVANDYASAANAYHRAHQRSPSSTLAIRRYQARERSGDIQRGLAELRPWIDANPNDLAARRVLALGYIRGGDLPAATQEHEWLAGELPDEPAIFNNLAWLYQQANDPRALTVAERAYELAPTEANVLDTLGWILVTEGQALRALKYLRDAISRSFETPAFHYHLGVALAQIERFAEARKELRLALAQPKPFAERSEARKLLDNITSK